MGRRLEAEPRPPGALTGLTQPHPRVTPKQSATHRQVASLWAPQDATGMPGGLPGWEAPRHHPARPWVRSRDHARTGPQGPAYLRWGRRGPLSGLPLGDVRRAEAAASQHGVRSLAGQARAPVPPPPTRFPEGTAQVHRGSGQGQAGASGQAESRPNTQLGGNKRGRGGEGTGGQVDGWTGGRVGRWTGGRVGGWAGGQVSRLHERMSRHHSR